MNQKSQSAMEYLMTYGWSILIIAVILGALAYLGVFNPLYFAPKANPGSCQVFRPNGAGTSYDINLLGVCNGEIPEFVASFPGNPASSQINLGQVSELGNLNSITITSWIDIPYSQSSSEWYDIVSKGPWCTGTFDTIIMQGGEISGASIGACKEVEIGSGITSGSGWHFVAYVANSAGFQFYVDNRALPPYLISISQPFPSSSYNVIIGAGSYGAAGVQDYNGLISDVQIYNTSLDQNSITAIYQEGIGGAPIDLQNLVGWWPLNGNANDYSGNGNNGASTGVAYTSSWISSYAQP